jgi:hypothetical protein
MSKVSLLSPHERGLVQPLRYLLAYLQLDFSEDHYSSKEELKKKTEGLSLVAAPSIVLRKGEVVMTNPQAACFFLLRTQDVHHLLGHSLREQLFV